MGNLGNVKSVYTSTEWTNREYYYINTINTIDLPADPTSGDIKRLISLIDSTLSEALLDYAFVRRTFQKYETLMKLATTEAFSMVKTAIPQINKPTADEVKSQVVAYLKINPLPGMKHSIYELVAAYEERFIFMQEINKMLQGKKESIITDNAMMKIEASIGGGQP